MKISIFLIKENDIQINDWHKQMLIQSNNVYENYNKTLLEEAKINDWHNKNVNSK